MVGTGADRSAAEVFNAGRIGCNRTLAASLVDHLQTNRDRGVGRLKGWRLQPVRAGSLRVPTARPFGPTKNRGSRWSSNASVAVVLAAASRPLPLLW